MPFPLSHWSNPRKTIANIFEHNDLAFIMHGFENAYKVLNKIEFPVNTLKSKTLLDYGCGEGRVARSLSFFFKEVLAYDPNNECIQESLKEHRNTNKEKELVRNIKYTTDLKGITTEFDYICCIDVFQHLNDKESYIEFNNILSKLKTGGTLIIWLCGNNKRVLKEFFNIESTIIDIYKYTK